MAESADRKDHDFVIAFCESALEKGSMQRTTTASAALSNLGRATREHEQRTHYFVPSRGDRNVGYAARARVVSKTYSYPGYLYTLCWWSRGKHVVSYWQRNDPLSGDLLG